MALSFVAYANRRTANEITKQFPRRNIPETDDAARLQTDVSLSTDFADFCRRHLRQPPTWTHRDRPLQVALSAYDFFTPPRRHHSPGAFFNSPAHVESARKPAILLAHVYQVQTQWSTWKSEFFFSSKSHFESWMFKVFNSLIFICIWIFKLYSIFVIFISFSILIQFYQMKKMFTVQW